MVLTRQKRQVLIRVLVPTYDKQWGLHKDCPKCLNQHTLFSQYRPTKPDGQFSTFHVCFCGLDLASLKFDRTDKQATYLLLGFETLSLKRFGVMKTDRT